MAEAKLRLVQKSRDPARKTSDHLPLPAELCITRSPIN